VRPLEAIRACRSNRPAQGVDELLRLEPLDVIWERLAPLWTTIDDALRRVEERYGAALDPNLAARAVLLHERRGDTRLERLLGVTDEDFERVRRVLKAALGEIEVVIERGPGSETHDTAAAGRISLVRLGAGAQRRALLAVLDLFRDPAIWPAGRFALLVIEEPEVGLDPGAQRRVAAALRELPTYGIQTVVVSHSPIMIGASDPTGWRLVRAGLGPARGGQRWREHHVVPATEVQAIAEELGAQPSDVLLARRFVVVEGDSDVQAFSLWARTLGSPLEDHGVRLVPAGGHGTAGQVGRVLDLVYAGADVHVVLDNGPDTAKTKLEIEARYGVPVTLLDRTEIEAYYSPAAVVAWVRQRAAPLDAPDERYITDTFIAEPSKRRLRDLATKFLARPYDVVNDGRAIVNLMREHEIPDKIKQLIYQWVAE
jgi:hypothetical protein